MAATDRARLVKLLRARHPCIAVVTNDEAWALTTVVGAAVDCARQVLSWSTVRGICEGMFAEEHQRRPDSSVPAKALRHFALEDHAKVLVALDLAPHLDDLLTLRALRELIDHCRTMRATLILIDHQDRLPPVVSRAAVRFDLSLPTDAELAEVVKESLRRLKSDEPRIAMRLTGAQFAELVRNLRGLTRAQAEQVIADVAVEDDAIDEEDVQNVLARKRRLLHTAGLLEYVEVPVSLDDVGGVAALKRWLAVRKRALDDHAVEAGIEPPRGILLLGVPGSGKSLCAKAIATAWQRPLLRLDAGVLYDKWVGESESRLREALKQAEAMAPMVLWIDEIEKAFASAASHSTDGGLSQRMFASLLTWMQERRSAVFLVATANDIEALPPELLRKGRFDEIFFVDLPDRAVRREIFRAHLARRKHDPSSFDLDALAERSDRFSGAEIEQAVVSAGIEAFAAGEPLATARVLASVSATTPLAVTMAEKVERLRDWARTRCASASDVSA
ncbi:MAG: AAA family ATPase [Planctomycetes bacterium]|nr:AAA family ATPase [Planctomycetota bacterium]